MSSAVFRIREWASGLFSNTQYFEEHPIKMQLYNMEQLVKHAFDIAGTHKAVGGPGRDLLIQRLADNESVLLDAYQRLNIAAASKQTISPAGEWLLDNFHIVELQIRTVRRHFPRGYSRKLPHLKVGANTSLPRVYVLSTEIISHVDGRVDLENISAFVDSYQKVSTLTLGELWAVPIMLRLALIENLRRVAARVVTAMKERSKATDWSALLLETATLDPVNLVLVVADMARSTTNLSNSFVAELQKGLQGHSPVLDIPISWLEFQLGLSGRTSSQTVLAESQQQAANQVTVSACILSLRYLDSTDWRDFVESLSVVERELRTDPGQVYALMTFSSRDRYRHEIEKLSKEFKCSELQVARTAIELSISISIPNSVDSRKSHVGYYLIGFGKVQLKGLLARNNSNGTQNVMSFLYSIRVYCYLGAIAMVTTILSLLIVGTPRNSTWSRFEFLFFGSLIALVISQIAVSFVNWLVTGTHIPKTLPRMDLQKGIPDDFRTIVAVPCMLITHKNIESLLMAMEIRYLANRDHNLFFCLLTDFVDSVHPDLSSDLEFLNAAERGVKNLNLRYGSLANRESIFFLMHRSRTWNPKEKVWMGYERKRGKLEALNELLRSGNGGPLESGSAFSLIVGELSRLVSVKYVITLDSDTQLPAHAAHSLVGTMAHPLNRPLLDVQGRVSEGYGILQPRVSVSLPGAYRSWFVRLYGGLAGTDPYTQAVSDVYQDIFGEGSFFGKGIYDVDACRKVLGNALPENLILSHDLLEGCYVRSGMASDITLYEEYPSNFGDDVKRRRRWIRGDWQIICWLLPFVPGPAANWVQNPISLLSKWKIFDNLRRSLVPLGALLVLVGSWFLSPGESFLTGFVIAVFLAPSFLSGAPELLTKANGVPWLQHLVVVFFRSCKRLTVSFLNLIFLPLDAAISLDSIGRSLFRNFVSHRHLLEWQSSGDPRSLSKGGIYSFYRSMWMVPSFSALVGGGLYFDNILGPMQFIFLFVWVLSPGMGFLLSRNIPLQDAKLSRDELKHLARVSRSTWRFFETFVGPEDNWLPPDNFQEYPTPIVAHRTSPTNMGLSLLANLNAYDFGYISVSNLIERTDKSLSTMARMERYRGHFYNWYDTRSLEPLSPRYVSTVDSGNLTGFLLTLKSGLSTLGKEPVISGNLLSSLREGIEFFLNDFSVSESISANCIALQKSLDLYSLSFASTVVFLELYSSILSELKSLFPAETAEYHAAESRIQELEFQLDDGLRRPVSLYAPWCFRVSQNASLFKRIFDDFHPATSLDNVLFMSPGILVKIDELLLQPLSASEKEWLELVRGDVQFGVNSISSLKDVLGDLCLRIDGLAKFEYEFLYDRDLHLLSIGYNATDRRRDDSFYDLLASEARLCSYIGIAQGHLPQEHWFALGRSLTMWKNSPMLVSWSGSMFEYLMPMLIMPSFPNTLLGKSMTSAVGRQVEYGNQRMVPWGISESGYNLTDVQLNYQYRAFGVPGLGIKRGLSEDLVVSPYSTLLALMVDPKAACANIKRMTDLGFESKYGYYEAVDYTVSRVSPKESVIIKSFMVHHQGMGFLSLGFLLLGQRMPKRFGSVPFFQAAELLLHERVPEAVPFLAQSSDPASVNVSPDMQKPELRVVETSDTSVPQVHFLSNGRYTVMVTNSGGGFSRWKSLAISRWREDPTSDNWGSFCYLRDLESASVWSSAHHPTLAKAESYAAIFPQARAEFRRSDHDIQVHTEIAVSPEDDIELRRYCITNRSSRRRYIEVTSYSEVVLAPPSADAAHPAFSNLFVETEVLAEKQTILCKRRPRSAEESVPTMFHLMCVHSGVLGDLSFETDRSQFLGRGRSTANPQAMDFKSKSSKQSFLVHELSGTEGSVLDPIVAIRCTLIIEPEQSLKVNVVTGIGETKEAAILLVDKYHDRHLAERVFELAWTHQQVTLRQGNLTEGETQVYAKLASYLLYANSARRADASVLIKNRLGQSGLWGYGISGDLPIVLLKVLDNQNMEVLRQLVKAQNYLRLMGIQSELIVWIDDPSSYRQELMEEIVSAITVAESSQYLERPGGIYVVRAEQMSQEDRILFQTISRATFSSAGGTLLEQIERRTRTQPIVPGFVPSRAPLNGKVRFPPFWAFEEENLRIVNQYGGFALNGKEYQIATDPSRITPAPWANVLANPFFGTVVSESGSAYTWCENAHEFRLTPWQNDSVSDQSGEAFYLRDEETGEFWSPTPLPVRSSSKYVTNHGFGFSKFRNETNGIATELTTFVALDAPVKMTTLRIRNCSGRLRRMSVTGYCEWVLGELKASSLLHVSTEVDPLTGAIFARNPFHSEFGSRIAFFDSSQKLRTFSGDRTEFIGRNRNLSSPEAMFKLRLSGRVGSGLDSCAAIQSFIDLADGTEQTLTFSLGVGRDIEDVHTLIKRFGSNIASGQALENVTKFWEQTLSMVQVSTPDPTLDFIANGWLVYQTLACRIWARSGSYQSGGAFGFRDQLQDAMALIHTAPNLLRAHLLRCASRQYREGDVQHWWHPPSGRGVRTHFSDDYLWLPLAASRYVLCVGDTGLLDVKVEFLEGREVRPDEEGYMDLPGRSEEAVSFYEHCVRAIRNSLKRGVNGLPLMGCGDWNDGMNLVGKGGKGESVWLAFFLFDVLVEFAKVSDLRQDHAFAIFCRESATELAQKIESNGWDGGWYRRAYFDDGTPLGSASNVECQIDSLPQSWSVLSGAGSRERSELAMSAVSQRLVDRKGRLVKLFDPPFSSSDLDPGYIKGYVPGVRENGGQYTHAAIWAAMAFAALDEKLKAWDIFNMINPINHSQTAEGVETYKVEPYVMAADVYAVPPHTGRGGWTWYTGSSGWMYRLVLESLLGIQLLVDRLYFKPCVPETWAGYTVNYRYRSTNYSLQFIKSLAADQKGSILVGGVVQREKSLLLIDDTLDHKVEVYY